MAAKKSVCKFTIDCDQVAKDQIIDTASLEKYFQDRIKVEGKTGVLGDNVVISRTDSTVVVDSKIAMSKRYLKYLTKKYLKKQQLRDFVHVIAPNKSSYKLKFFNANKEDEE